MLSTAPDTPTRGAILTVAIYTLLGWGADIQCASSGLSLDVCLTPQTPRAHLYLGFNGQGPLSWS